MRNSLRKGGVDEAVKRLLTEQFKLGLFENPYVEADQADSIVGNEKFRAKAMNAQRESIVLLQNSNKLLPLISPTSAKPVKLYVVGMTPSIAGSPDYGGFAVTSGDATTPGTRPSAAGNDYALIRVEVANAGTNVYRSNDPATGGRINPATRQPWGAQDRTGLDNTLMFGSAFPWEVNSISFTEMAKAQSWKVTPALADIQAVMNEVGAKNTILAIYFR